MFTLRSAEAAGEAASRVPVPQVGGRQGEERVGEEEEAEGSD